jgi:hypothetical protein
MDFVGLATLISSATASISTLVILYRGRVRDKSIAQIAKGVDGMTEKLVAATAVSSHAEGVIAGHDAERENPTPG